MDANVHHCYLTLWATTHRTYTNNIGREREIETGDRQIERERERLKRDRDRRQREREREERTKQRKQVRQLVRKQRNPEGERERET